MKKVLTMSSKKVIFFGTPQIAVDALENLHKSEFEVVAVVTQPDKTKGRNRHKLVYGPVKEKALELGIEVLQPEKCKDEEFLDRLKGFDADFFCVFAFGQILPQKLLDIPKDGCFNAHASLLPKLRGAAPINWCIVNGDTHTGMSIQKMVFKLDAGPVCWSKKITIAQKETAETLALKMVPLASEGFLATLRMSVNGTLDPLEQDESLASYAPILKKNDGEIDWSKSATEIDRMVRGFYPWPAATTTCGSDILKIFDVEVDAGESSAANKPGKVLSCTKDGISVACGQGTVLIKELQKQGKKRMQSEAFLCGNKFGDDDYFGNRS